MSAVEAQPQSQETDQREYPEHVYRALAHPTLQEAAAEDIYFPMSD